VIVLHKVRNSFALNFSVLKGYNGQQYSIKSNISCSNGLIVYKTFQ